jgi:hypothetical protein
MSFVHRKTFVMVIGAIVLFAIMVVATYFLFVVHAPGANDFYPRWKGAQLFWQEGIDPYSTEATAAIQRGIYGRLAKPTEDQVLFVYPFYTVFLLLPLAWLPYGWVQAIWLVTLMASLVAGTVLCLRFLRWQPPLWLTTAIILWSLILYNGTRTIILGQFAGLIFLWLMGSLVALRRGKDVTAAVLLALTTIKPQMSFLLIPALLLWGIGQRRWRFVWAFVLSMGLLTGASFLLAPRWLFDFIDQVMAYPGYTVEGSPIYIITRIYWPQLGRVTEILLFVALVVWLLTQWWRLPRLPIGSADFLYVLCVTLVVTNLVVSRTATTNYVVLYLPILWGIKLLALKWRWGGFAATGVLLILIVGMWLLFLNTISGSAESAVMFLPLPFGLLVLLLLAKRAFLSDPLSLVE